MAGVVAVDGQEVNLTYEPQSPMSNPYHHLTKDADAKPFVVGLVQARMGSTRLPGKVLLPLPKENGMPVLWHDFNRLKACKNVDKWVLATSTWHTDTVLEEFAKEHGRAWWIFCSTQQVDKYKDQWIEQFRVKEER